MTDRHESRATTHADDVIFGLPMRRDGGGFRDVVSGRMVYSWVDTKGRKWLAHHRWDLIGRVARDLLCDQEEGK